MLTKTQIKNYCNKIWDIAFSDGLITYPPDDSNFLRAFRNYMKAIAKANNWELLDYKHHPYCEFTCFFKKGDRYIYLNSGDYRMWRSPYKSTLDILYRGAKNEKDYRGNHNNFCNLEEIEQKLIQAFECEGNFRW